MRIRRTGVKPLQRSNCRYPAIVMHPSPAADGIARDYREGTHLCPTFDDAVTRHRMLDAIEKAAATGQHQRPG